MKILHLFRETNAAIGGVQHHIQYLTQAQLALGLKPYVLTFKMADEDKLTIENREGVVWYFLDIRDPLHQWVQKMPLLQNGVLEFFHIALSRIRQNYKIEGKLQLITEIDPDIIHQHDYLSSIRLSRSVSQKFNIVFTNHYGEYLLLNKTRLTRYFQNAFLSNFRFIIASSHNLLPKKNSFHIPNGVDLSIFSEKDSVSKAAFQSGQNLQNKVVFLCARRWAPNKGVLYLVQALNLLSAETKQNATFLFAGNDDEDFPVYRKKVMDELQKSSGIDYKLFGNLNHNELSMLIKTIDVGIIPSLVEGMSLASIELIACGIPVLATNIGGLPEIIIPEENGWLVPSKNAGALASEITQIVTHWPESNLKIETAAFRKKYSWDTIAKQTLEIYNQV